MDPAQDLSDLFPQLKRGADLPGTLLCQYCDLRDHGQPGQQVGHTSAAAFELVIGAFVNAERRRDDPVDFNPVSGCSSSIDHDGFSKRRAVIFSITSSVQSTTLPSR